MRRFASEIAQLRALGFAEGLPIEPSVHARPVAARLESGRIGVAVEFLEPDSPATYAVMPLDADAHAGPGLASDTWEDIIGSVHRCAPAHDDD
ncbi:MAG TPA: hypothetical protein VGQ23_09450 [Burkholderiaceae bacterium]|jgi:hypothetical protein|nr:hypothetical protein [Burkholderiaceae bacterium]